MAGVVVGSGLSVTGNGTLSVNLTVGLQQLNKIIFAKLLTGGGSIEIWTMNYDGSNQSKVNIAMPAGQVISDLYPKLSPDGKKIFFIGSTTSSTNNDDDIYSCNIDGTNMTKIYDMPVGIQALGEHTNGRVPLMARRILLFFGFTGCYCIKPSNQQDYSKS